MCWARFECLAFLAFDEAVSGRPNARDRIGLPDAFREKVFRFFAIKASPEIWIALQSGTFGAIAAKFGEVPLLKLGAAQFNVRGSIPYLFE
jgi:hypothetical protein